MREATITAAELEKLYIIRDGDIVWRYLFNHPQLAQVLIDAHQNVQKHFGLDSQIELRVISDPEIPGWDQLFAYVHTALPVDEALARLDRLDDDWIETQPSHIDELFTISLNCI